MMCKYFYHLLAQLRNEADDDIQTVVHYISAHEELRVDHTVLRTIYEHALDNVGDDLLLQRCNRIVLHPKQRNIQDYNEGDIKLVIKNPQYMQDIE